MFSIKYLWELEHEISFRDVVLSQKGTSQTVVAPKLHGTKVAVGKDSIHITVHSCLG